MNIDLIEPESQATENLPAAPEVRAALALKSSKTEGVLRELATKHASIKEIKDKAGREQAHGAAMELMRARTAIKKAADEARDDAKKFNAAVITEERRLTAIVEPEETRLKTLRDNWDEAERQRKEAEAAAERARLHAITERIATLRGYVSLAAQCRNSERIQSLYDKLDAEPITAEAYQEFETEANLAKTEALGRIKNILEAKLAEEAARRAEQERIEQQRREAAEAKARAEEEARRVAAERAELERQQRELREAQGALRRQQEAMVAASRPATVEVVAEAKVDETLAPAVAPAPVEPEEVAPATDADVADWSAVTDPTPERAAAVDAALQAKPKAIRPSDDEIIAVLSLHFRAHESSVIAWLLEMDLNAASERLMSECA